MNLKSSLLTDKLSEILEERFIVFCGAGISIPPPSCSPSWWNLTEEIIEVIFKNVPDEYNIPKDMIIKDSNKQPEAVFENFANILHERFYNVFEVLNVSKPNALHIILARMAKKGLLKACFTTNFDIYLERALKNEGVDFDLLVENQEYENYCNEILNSNLESNMVVCKIHGTIERPNTIISVASAYKTAKGFSIPKANVFKKYLSRYPCLFLGYSGWDFIHLNYLRFWERVGPNIKKIYWNRRLNERSGPNFDEIFKNHIKKIEFIQGELPNDLIKAINQIPYIQIDINDINLEDQKKTSVQYDDTKLERLNFLKNWAIELSDSHKIGLVLSESTKFSKTYKEYVEKSKNFQATETTTIDSYKKLDEITQMYSEGKITMEEMDQKRNEVFVEMKLEMLNKQAKDFVKDMIEKNRYPGITDNNSNLHEFINYMNIFTIKFNREQAAELAADLVKEMDNLRQQRTKQAAIEQNVLNVIAGMRHPNDELWKPYAKRINIIKERYFSNEITEEQYNEEIRKINIECMNKQQGQSIDIYELFKTQINIVANSETKKEFEDQAEALANTIIQIIGEIAMIYMRSKEYKEIDDVTQAHITNKDPSKTLNTEKLETYDKLIRNDFLLILQRIKILDTNVKLLMEMIFLSIWIISTEDLVRDEYLNLLNSGEYPRRDTHPMIYNYLYNKYLIDLDNVLDNLPARFVQKLTGMLTILSEMGNDVNLCEKVTFKSLELSEGIVTEATSQNIPSALAGFYDRQGDSEKALQYYSLALEGLKSNVIPIKLDTIIYRVALIYYNSSNQKKALEIIGRYHPNYGGNSYIALPTRKYALELAEKTATELGYSNVQNAMEDILT